MFYLPLCLGTLTLMGCNGEKTQEQKNQKSAEMQEEHHDDPDKGPHSGSLIELGVGAGKKRRKVKPTGG